MPILKMFQWYWLNFWVESRKESCWSILVIIETLQGEQFHQQTYKTSYNNTFYQPSVSKVEFLIDTGKYPNVEWNWFYENDKFSQAYGEVFSCFKHLTKDDTLQPYIIQEQFKILKIIRQTLDLDVSCMFLTYDITKSLLLLKLWRWKFQFHHLMQLQCK